MKYIRTKDEIYEQNDIVRIAKALAKEMDYDYEHIKEADTIEELCDEFIVCADSLGIGQHDSHSVRQTIQEAIQDLKIYKANHNRQQIIYGAIWTDKGLIYVAKMNDKGELELI